MELDYVCVLCMYVRHPFENDHYICSYASQTPMTIHILKAYDEGYSKIIRGHEYKVALFDTALFKKMNILFE